jgi:cytoskeleton protein RodZ
MGISANPTPREFGEALRAHREGSGVTLAEIGTRTKISRRTLEAFESGEFGWLPRGALPRLFLKQYLEMIGEAPEPWLSAFALALDRYASDTQPVVLVAPLPARGRRIGPWLVGLALVGAALVGVLAVEHRQDGQPTHSFIPTPEALPSPRVAAPAPASPEQTPAPSPDPDTLVVRGGERACWVEVRVAGEQPQSRLVDAGTVWEVAAGGRAVDLVLGDAGSAEVEYLGRRLVSPGRSGEVLHLHLAPETGEATPTAVP